MTTPAPSLLASRRSDALSDIEDALDAIGVPKNHWRPRFKIIEDQLAIDSAAGPRLYFKLEDPRSADEIAEDLQDEREIEEGAAGDAAYETWKVGEDEACHQTQYGGDSAPPAASLCEA